MYLFLYLQCVDIYNSSNWAHEWSDKIIIQKEVKYIIIDRLVKIVSYISREISI